MSETLIGGVLALGGAIIGALITAHYAFHSNRLATLRTLVLDIRHDLNDLYRAVAGYMQPNATDGQPILRVLERFEDHLLNLEMVFESKADPLKRELNALCSKTNELLTAQELGRNQVFRAFNEQLNVARSATIYLYKSIKQSGPFGFDK